MKYKPKHVLLNSNSQPNLSIILTLLSCWCYILYPEAEPLHICSSICLKICQSRNAFPFIFQKTQTNSNLSNQIIVFEKDTSDNWMTSVTFFSGWTTNLPIGAKDKKIQISCINLLVILISKDLLRIWIKIWWVIIGNGMSKVFQNRYAPATNIWIKIFQFDLNDLLFSVDNL